MKYFALIAPIALLSACSQSNDTGADADGDGTISQEEVAAEAQAAADDVKVRPGQWEGTMRLTELDIPGMPEEARAQMQQAIGREQTQTSCITPEEAENPDANFFGDAQNDECEYTDFSMSDGRVLIAGTCTPEGLGGTMSLRMEGTYSETEYNMSMSMETDGGPTGGMTMAGEIEGRFVGPDCGGEG